HMLPATYVACRANNPAARVAVARILPEAAEGRGAAARLPSRRAARFQLPHQIWHHRPPFAPRGGIAVRAILRARYAATEFVEEAFMNKVPWSLAGRLL